jgi:hypothetical protein
MSTPNVIHEVTIHWLDKSVYDQRRNFNCSQMITIVLNKSATSKEYYYIMYKWLYDVNTPEEHPFCCDPIVSSETSAQECLWRNKESDSLVKYLVMSDTDLAKYSGSRGPSCFRRDIIRAIANLGKNCNNTGVNKVWEGGWGDANHYMNGFRVYPGDGTDTPGLGGPGWIVCRI